MIIYFAGAEQNHHCLKLQEANVRNILCSYYHDSFRNHQAKPSRKFKRVFLDSGAFSSYTKNTVIDIDNYIRYIKDNDDNLELYSCLDVIGDWKATLKNQKHMEKNKLNPLWCFHFSARQTEPYSLLEDMIQKYDYIALGGMATRDVSKKALKRHLDKCFNIIGKYLPKKIHGFGLTAVELLLRYPFYSSDSTAWLAGEKQGTCYKFTNGRMKGYSSRSKEDMLSLNRSDFTDIDQKNYRNRSINNAKEFLKAQEFITDVWQKRGITFA